MTGWERFLAFANFEPVDKVPRRANFTAACLESITAHLGKAPHEAFAMDNGRGCDLRPPDDYVKPDHTPWHEDMLGQEGYSIDINGCGHLSHGFYHFTERFSPLRNVSGLEAVQEFPMFTNEGWLDDTMRETVIQAHAEGEHAVAWVGHIYESSWQVRGYEPFLVDLLTDLDVVEYILEHYTQNKLRTAVAAARAGCDVLQCGDDVASQQALMFKKELWQKVMKPRWARVWQAAREIKPDIQIWYHSDGNIWDILDDLVDVGVTILNPVQPECMDPLAIRKRFGKRLAFDGCVGTQTTFPFGKPEDMRRVIHELGTSLDARQGGLMLSPTHVLEPEVPPENIVTFFEACDEL